jgi:hypothetical protein
MPKLAIERYAFQQDKSLAWDSAEPHRQKGLDMKGFAHGEKLVANSV